MLRHSDTPWFNPRVLSTLAVVFLCGMAFGSVCMRGYLRSRWTTSERTTPAIETARHVGLGALRIKLNLSEAQEQTITKILDDYGKYYQNIEDERQDVAKYGSQRILDTLTGTQKDLFNDLERDKIRK